MEEKSYESKQLPAPTWLSGAVVRPQQASSSTSSFVNDAAQQHQQQQQQHQQAEAARKWCGCEPGSQCVRCSFLHLPSTAAASTAPAGGPAAGRPSSLSVPPSQQASGNSTNPWLTSPAMAMASAKLQAAVSASDLAAGSDVAGSESLMALSTHHHHQQDVNHGHSPNLQQGRAGGQLLDLHSDTANSSDLVDGDGGGGGAGGGGGDQQHHHQDSQAIWQNARLKADISMHPLYDQLLAAHVACLRVATPVDQLPRIDAQISQASQVLTKYSVLGQNHLLVGEEKEELDQFMTHYVLLLCTFKEQLQQHVRVHAMEAVMACWELEQSLLSLTGVSPGEGTGATMSDDDDDPGDSDPSIYDTGFDAHDSGAFGPLIPTETERSLMERVRQELKNELKSGYKDRIVDVREEILRKRRAGKLPGDTTSVLKAWWQAHSKWPYPTEDEKARLVQETGLQLKQINNWFINQRKRNWHSNPSSTAALKNKRKR